ncbi:hypothetical protein [Paramagnetospirillum caucaseum]|uniref:hypothetical protein n=1 Tax=Paramagnetospirillum caucaseum TaxID=1244869 RepID=UPI00058D3DF7|nr:hypothetical protein [Paramagnetospirillum caucaseum]
MTTENTPKRRPRQRDLLAPLDALTPGQQRVIACLARYRYMTVRQFVDAGAGKHESTVRDHLLYRLARRVRGNLLQYREYFAVSAHRRRPFVYALTQHGATVAAELLDVEAESIRYPVGGIAHVHDYEHREAYIDVCIALDRWAEAGEARETLFLSHYFDKTGANRKGIPSHSVNRFALPGDLGNVEPDGIFFVDTGTKRRALALELNNTTDTKRAVEKLLKLTHAVQSGCISEHLGHDKANFVLSVAMTPEASALIRSRIATAKGFATFSPAFLFNDLATIKESGFASGWKYADGSSAEGVFE